MKSTRGSSSPGGPLRTSDPAFDQLEYQVNGALSGEFHLYGKYTAPFGFGRMSIDDVVAYGESFESATAGLRFEGAGVRLDGVEIRKGDGLITGAAYVDWDGTYTFNADGRRIPMETVAAVSTARRRCRASCSSRRPASARSRRRSTTCAGGSTACSCAMRAWARSPGESGSATKRRRSK